MCVLIPLRVWRGETKVFRFTIWDVDTDAPADLDVYEGIEFEVKTAVDGEDPALIHKDLAGGIVVLDQDDEDLVGKLEVTLAPEDTSGIAPGVLKYDLWGIIGDNRYLLARPSDFYIEGVVNGAEETPTP
jgi:hypothetical protein